MRGLGFLWGFVSTLWSAVLRILLSIEPGGYDRALVSEISAWVRILIDPARTCASGLGRFA